MSDYLERDTVFQPPHAVNRLPHIYAGCDTIRLVALSKIGDSTDPITEPFEMLKQWDASIHSHLIYLAQSRPADRKDAGGTTSLFAAVLHARAARVEYHEWSNEAWDVFWQRKGRPDLMFGKGTGERDEGTDGAAAAE